MAYGTGSPVAGTARASQGARKHFWQEIEDDRFHAGWLEFLVTGLGGVREAVLVLGAPNVGPFQPVAFWPPDTVPGAALVQSCEQCLEMRLPLSRAGKQGAGLVVPILRDADLLGVVGILFSATQGPEPARAVTVKDMVYGLTGWLLYRVAAQDDLPEQQLRERLLVLLELMMVVLEEERAATACQSVVTEAAVRLQCDRLALGFGARDTVRMEALSHAADFIRQVDLVQAIEAAMNEAADQGCTLHVTDSSVDASPESVQVTYAHKQLMHRFGNRELLSVPFFVRQEAWGVFTFEWPETRLPTAADRRLAEGMVPILGRLLLEKRERQRPWWRRAAGAALLPLKKLFGPRHLGYKFTFFLLLPALVTLGLLTGEFRIASKAVLEGGVRRVMVAPYDGFVASSTVRAGHVVRRDEDLAVLDDRDARLEVLRWSSQQHQYMKQLHDAESKHDLSQLQIIQAQVQQAMAQRALAESMLERARVKAPFDGLIISGDLSQHLGGAVRKGQVLFEIAPLESYRIALDVDESDIDWLEVGQTGTLLAAALPGETFPFIVTLITPVAHAYEGRNYFRVEAGLIPSAGGAERLRPGMEGIGKIAIDTRPLVWIWTRPFVVWLRLQMWSLFGV